MDAAIVGTWECLDDSVPHEWLCLLTFSANGRFVDGDGDEGRFQTRERTLTLNFDDFSPISFSYNIIEDQLTLLGDDTRMVLTRR